MDLKTEVFWDRELLAGAQAGTWGYTAVKYVAQRMS